MSPAPESGREKQQLTPLSAFTIRLGSRPVTSAAIRAVSYSPQPSLNGTQPTIDVTLRSWSTIARRSASKCALASGTGSGRRPGRGSGRGGSLEAPGHRRNVLPHQQSQLVSPVVPARGLDLHVLADEV